MRRNLEKLCRKGEKLILKHSDCDISCMEMSQLTAHEDLIAIIANAYYAGVETGRRIARKEQKVKKST